jgi:thiosulfate reductase cytochrome b subunit
MADSVWTSTSASATPVRAAAPRHSLLVRVTHWLTVIAFFALLITGIEILISHPRFYWGETGNVNTEPLFRIPIPSSRSTVPTGYGYVLPDQNGWSRYLHFEAAWLLALTGLLYFAYGVVSRHFQRNILPARGDLSWNALSAVMVRHLRFTRPAKADGWSYNALQRLSYAVVVFVLFPLVVWTGLAMSPAIAAAFPSLVTLLGGQQSARTIHFFVSIVLTAFLAVHVAMVIFSGFGSRMRAMLTGHVIK